MKNNIKIIAQARGIKLSKLRQYVNMSSSTFSLLVNNKREIDPNTLNTLSDVLSCTPEEILGEKDFNIKLLSSKDVKNKSNINEEYIDLALEIIYDIEEERGIDINKGNKVRIIKEIYLMIEDFYNENTSKFEIVEKITNDMENPIIEGVNMPKLIISKIKCR